MGATISTELRGLKVQRKPEESAVFNPPECQMRGAWANELVSTFGQPYLRLLVLHAVGEDFFIPLNVRYEVR